MSKSFVRWGILGTGQIARAFAQGLRDVPDAALVAVASRSIDTARAFAADFSVRPGGVRAHGTYE